MAMFRGYEIHKGKDGEWLFSETNELVSTTWRERPCGHCNAANTPGGYDGCIGHLPGVMNACCGHGDWKAAYIQFASGFIIRGAVARAFYVAAITPVTRMSPSIIP